MHSSTAGVFHDLGLGETHDVLPDFLDCPNPGVYVQIAHE